MEHISEARLTLICPKLADKIRTLAEMLAQEGNLIRVVQGLRSWTEQDALYAMGRTAPGKIVTNVKGGYSWHCFGMAVDCVPSINGCELAYHPDWNKNSSRVWGRMIEVGKSLGLTCGALWRTFPDAPHFQLTGRFPAGGPNDEVRQLFKDGGMEPSGKSREYKET
jgi:peptidoglycan L-alanyl-D-glutamate endopeptidase CwlK